MIFIPFISWNEMTLRVNRILSYMNYTGKMFWLKTVLVSKTIEYTNQSLVYGGLKAVTKERVKGGLERNQ